MMECHQVLVPDGSEQADFTNRSASSARDDRIDALWVQDVFESVDLVNGLNWRQRGEVEFTLLVGRCRTLNTRP